MSEGEKMNYCKTCTSIGTEFCEQCPHKFVDQGYESYGDVNPLEHGGQWVKKTEIDHEYSIVSITPYEDKTDEKDLYSILFSTCVIDITDSWIDKDAVTDYADTPKDNEEVYALDILSYYGALNCNGEEEHLTREQVVERLTNLGIEVE